MSLDMIWTTIRSWFSGTDLTPFHLVSDALMSMTVRGTIVLLLVGIIARVLHRRSAAQLHLMWMIACGIMLAIPVYSSVGPKWEAPVLQSAGTIATIPSTVVGLVSEGSATEVTQLLTEDFPVFLTILGIWALGFIVALIFLVLSHIRASQLVRQSVKTTDFRVLYILKDIQRSLLPNRAVVVLQNNDVMPITYGTLSPVILLPSDLTSWSDDRLRNVLIHELAHIKRFDCLLYTMALLLCAIQWFNPLVWYTVFQLRALREEACDNYVLTSGYKPSGYATHLLDIVEALRGSAEFQLSAAPFVRKSRIQQRLQSIMNVRRVRTHVSWRSNTAAAVLAGIITIPLSAFSPVPRTIESPTMVEASESFPNNSAHKQDSQLIEENAYLTEKIKQPQQNRSMIKRVTPIVAGALLAAGSAHADTVVRENLTLPDSIEAAEPGQITIIASNGKKLTQFPGIKVDSATKVSVKDNFRVNNDPIIILDGKRISNNNDGKSLLDQLDVNSIETINVLKGPSAVRLYGPEAASGVIVITTKKNR